ncbi:MAG: hypothetical protein K5985_08405 [Lachnospiraceae bacterium]|nr:hypothetical protein [Lachnospiraceae bacterium]
MCAPNSSSGNDTSGSGSGSSSVVVSAPVTVAPINATNPSGSVAGPDAVPDPNAVVVAAPVHVAVNDPNAGGGAAPGAPVHAPAAPVHAPVVPVQARPPIAAAPRQMNADEWALYMKQLGSVSSLEEKREDGSTELDDVKEAIGASVPAIVQEIRGGKTESSFKTWKRKRAFASKKKVFDADAVQRWKLDRRAGNQGWRNPPNPPAAPPQAQDQAFTAQEIANIKRLKTCTTDFMKYTDDAAFVKHFDTLTLELEGLAEIKTLLESHEKSNFDAIGDPDMGTFDEAKKTAEGYVNILAFYRAKMDLISNPFYMALKKEDTEGLDAHTCEQRARIYRSTDPPRTDLADYLDAMARLKELEAQGTFRDWNGDGAYRTEYADGLKKNRKAHIAFFTRETAVKADLPALKIGGRDWMGTYKDGKYLTGDYDRTKEKKDDKGKPILGEDGKPLREEKDSNVWGKKFGLGAGVEVNGRAKIIEGGYDVSHTTKHGVKMASSGDFSVGEVEGHGRIGASFSIKDGKLEDAFVGVDVGGSVALAKGSVKASLGKEITSGFFDEKVTYTAIGAEASANVEVATASANAYAKAGRVTVKDALTGESQTIDGIAVGVDAQAALLSGSVKGSIVIFGVKIGATLSGQLGGAGVSAGLYAGSGKVGLSFGALLGLGAKLDLSIDASFWTQKLASYITKKVAAKGSPLDRFKKKK